MPKLNLNSLIFPLAFAGLSLVSACASTQISKQPIPPQKPIAQLDETLELIPNKCADNGPSFKETGICQGRASNYMNMLTGPEPELPDGCEWTNQQTPFADAFLLYRAAKCGNVTSKLEYAGGAHSANLILVKSAISPDAYSEVKPKTLATIITVQSPKDYQSIVRFAVDKSKKENKTCHVIKDPRPDAYKEGLVIDVAKSIANKTPKDDIRSACDNMGYDEDSANFWYIAQNYAWYLDLGQDDDRGIDIRSLTLIEKGKDGSWGAVN